MDLSPTGGASSASMPDFVDPANSNVTNPFAAVSRGMRDEMFTSHKKRREAMRQPVAWICVGIETCLALSNHVSRGLCSRPC